MQTGSDRNAPSGWQITTATAAWISGAAAMGVVCFLLISIWPLFTSGEIVRTITGPWRPFATDPSHGIGPMVLVSLILALVATALAFPAAIGIVAFINGVGPRPLRKIMLATVQFMTSIPTVVYGFVAVMILVPLIRKTFTEGSGFCLLAAILMLAMLILPTIVLVIQAHLAQSDRKVYSGCLALGMTPAQALGRVILPSARSSLVTAFVLGFCRALGDTLIALMVAGNAAQLPGSVLDSVRALTAHIALVLATDSFSPEYRSVAAAAVFLFLLTSGLSLTIRRLEDRR